MTKIVLASSNKHKIKELSALLAPLKIELISQAALGISDVEETGLSFVENALLKARHASRLANLPALADDSGLVVPALNGAPGIYSARYAGAHASSEENIKKLLDAIKDVPETGRAADFYCSLTLFQYPTDPTPLIAEGRWQGMIVAPEGQRGFGYDPVFYVPSENKTAAQLTPERKNQLSHRGQAIRSLLAQLQTIFNLK
jgi:XTP/dITP diphosphohydrolase